jgi:hypothetical protein
MNWSDALKTTVIDITVVLVIIFVVLEIRELIRHIRKRRAIHQGAREARKVERERKAEIKRIKKQTEIGEPILREVQRAWVNAGSVSNRKISIVSTDDGDYRIEITSLNEYSCSVEKLMMISVDLRRSRDRQVFIHIGRHMQWHDVSCAMTQIQYLIAFFKVFKA